MARKNIFTTNVGKTPVYQFSLDDEAGQKDFLNKPSIAAKKQEVDNAVALNRGDDAYLNSIKPKISQQSGNTYTIPLVTPDTDGVDYLSQLLTTPEQEAEYRKDNINAQKIALIGDALRQVGNVITTSKGAVPQQFSASPVVGLAAEYKADKAKRDANNLRYYSAKQQERIAEAKNALAKQEMQYKRAMDAFNIQYKLDAANRAQEEKERERKHKSEEEEKKREFTAKENKLDRETSTRNAYIRSNGGSDKDTYGYQTPYGRGFKAKDFTATQINQLYGYADANNLINRSEIKAKMKELGLNEDAFEAKRQVVMDLLATNKDFADLVIANYNLKADNPNITPNNTNNANANTSSGGIVLPTPIWQRGNTESGKDENGKGDLRDLLGTKG